MPENDPSSAMAIFRFVAELIIAPLVVFWLWESLWKEKFLNKIKIRRILTSDDSDAEGFLDLYSHLFADDGTNYTAGEMLEFLNTGKSFAESRHVEVDNIALVAKHRGEVVGLLMACYYPPRKKAIIAYYGIDPRVFEARRSAAALLLKELKRILLDGKHPCEYIFFDLQGVDQTLSKPERSERRARSILFKQRVKPLGLRAYHLQFDYRCPKVSLEDDKREYPFSLLVVPLTGELVSPVPKLTPTSRPRQPQKSNFLSVIKTFFSFLDKITKQSR